MLERLMRRNREQSIWMYLSQKEVMYSLNIELIFFSAILRVRALEKDVLGPFEPKMNLHDDSLIMLTAYSWLVPSEYIVNLF